MSKDKDKYKNCGTLKPGNTVAKDFYASLGPPGSQERKDYFDRRTAKTRLNRMERSVAQDTEIMLRKNKYEIISKLLEGADVLMDKAIKEKDPQAWIAVYDRVVGKPKQSIEVDGNLDSVITTKVLRFDGRNDDEE